MDGPGVKDLVVSYGLALAFGPGLAIDGCLFQQIGAL
jgi:predicted naringenin-chalcone synthase